MTDQDPRPNTSRTDDRPVMGDHPDLEMEDQTRTPPAGSEDGMARLFVPGIIVLVIVLAVIAYFLWFD
jgi:hypothetical protein